MEGAQADEVRAVPFQFHPARLGQALERDFALEPLDLAPPGCAPSVDLLFSPFPAFPLKTCQEETVKNYAIPTRSENTLI